MSPDRLVDHSPELAPDELVAGLVPPPRFDAARFSTYVPNPAEPSQAAAVSACAAFAERAGAFRGGKRLGGLFGRKRPAEQQPAGLYLDGGFGVGKTHLLASTWHAATGPKSYATFVELTHLVGVLGFTEAVRQLSGHRLLAVDEFELDDPGDTMLITRLLGELLDAGVRVAATSNTLPDKLGEGRFAAADFLREIQTLSARFGVVTVDGLDYRHRGMPEPPEPMSDAALAESAAALPGATLDDFVSLCSHLAGLHPSRYGKLVDGVPAVHLRGLRPAPDQTVALRLVSLADRLYDRAVPVAVSGVPLDELFPADMLAGGYRKKYLRAVSRLTALSRADTAVASG